MAEKLKDVKHNGKQVWAQDNIAAIKAVNADSRTLHIVGSTEQVDRDGDIVQMRGIDLGSYLKNPVFLWSHDYSSVPVAAAQKVMRKRNPNRLEFQIRFPKAGIYPFADMLLELYKEKIINASSIGFLPSKWEDLEEEGGRDGTAITRYRKGRRFMELELLELSGCAVPCNPGALQNSMAASKRFQGTEEGQLRKWSEMLTRQKAIEPDDIEKARDMVMDMYKSVEIEDEYAPFKMFVADVPGSTEGVEPKDVTELPDNALEPIKGNVATLEDETGEPSVKEAMKIQLTEEMQKMIDDAVKMATQHVVDTEIARIFGKSGAVLNKKNKDALKAAQELIQVVIDSAETPAEENPVEAAVPDKAEDTYWEKLLQQDEKEEAATPVEPVREASKGETIVEPAIFLTPEQGKQLKSSIKELRKEFPRLF